MSTVDIHFVSYIQVATEWNIQEDSSIVYVTTQTWVWISKGPTPQCKGVVKITICK